VFCNSCGHKIEAGERFCTGCGTPVEVRRPVKTGSSSRLLKIIGIPSGAVLAIVLLALLVGGTGGPGGPEQTIRSFYREAERLNASRQADFIVQEHRAIWAQTLGMTYAMMDSFSISNLTIRVTSQAGDTAEAVAEYSWSYRGKDGSTYSQRGEVDHFQLVRVGGRWLIQETDFIFD